MNNNTTVYSLFLAQQSAVLQYCRIYLSLCHKHVRVSLLIHCFAYHHFCYVCPMWCIQYSHNNFFYFAFVLSLAFYSSSFVLMLFIFSVIISRVLIRCHFSKAPFLLLFLLLISRFFICCCSSYHHMLYCSFSIRK